MAEARPSVNHVTFSISSIGPAKLDNLKSTHDLNCAHERNSLPPGEKEGWACTTSLIVPASNSETVEMDTESDIKLPPDVMHINGFYTIADTLHKENANSAVTRTTQSQMGEVRMSSRVAEPSSNYINHGHNNLHDWTKNISPFANDLQVRMPKQMIESGSDSLNPDLADINECVDKISLAEDITDCCAKLEGCKHGSLPELGTELLDANLVNDIPLICDNDFAGQPVEPSVRKKDRQKKSEETTNAAEARSSDIEEVPTGLSEFVLGHEQGQSHLALHVPADDSDLDSILPNGFEVAVKLVPYESELQMPDIMRLITKDLSEPYSIYTYRYFIHNWPKLCFLAMHGPLCVGAIVCKLDVHKKVVHRGYIAMLAVDEKYRKHKIGSSLVRKAIRAMIRGQCDEVVLETEITNKPALQLYENLGFSRDKRLFRYYLNGVDALRLKLWLR